MMLHTVTVLGSSATVLGSSATCDRSVSWFAAAMANQNLSSPFWAAGVGRAGSAGASASEPPTSSGFVKLADELVLCEAAPIASGGASPAPCGASPASCGASQARTPS